MRGEVVGINTAIVGPSYQGVGFAIPSSIAQRVYRKIRSEGRVARGKIALANRGKEPLYLFAALQRHLGYPTVPRPRPLDDQAQLLPQILRRLERIETRIKLLEEEQQGGIDITKFYSPGNE